MTWRISVSETTLLYCVWRIALSLELDQLVITRGAELHNEGSAAPSTEQGNPMALNALHFQDDDFPNYYCETYYGTGDYASTIFLSLISLFMCQTRFSYHNF